MSDHCRPTQHQDASSISPGARRRGFLIHSPPSFDKHADTDRRMSRLAIAPFHRIHGDSAGAQRGQHHHGEAGDYDPTTRYLQLVQLLSPRRRPAAVSFLRRRRRRPRRDGGVVRAETQGRRRQGQPRCCLEHGLRLAARLLLRRLSPPLDPSPRDSCAKNSGSSSSSILSMSSTTVVNTVVIIASAKKARPSQGQQEEEAVCDSAPRQSREDSCCRLRPRHERSHGENERCVFAFVVVFSPLC